MNRNQTLAQLTQDITDIRRVHEKFQFIDNYLPVFLCLHICVPEHFREQAICKEQVKKIFNALNLSSYTELMRSIFKLQPHPIRNNLLAVCEASLLRMLFKGEKAERKYFLVQVKNMELLYLKANFREHMITLYTHFIKQFM